MKSGIYKIRNKLNNKIYIGSSANIKSRWACHVAQLNGQYHHSVYLQRSWNKYGSDNFIFEIIENCTVDKLLEIEQNYLDTLKPYDVKNGYNTIRIAGGVSGYTHTTESKELMRNAKLGINLSDEHKQKIKMGCAGRKLSESHKQKLSIIKKNKPTGCAATSGINHPKSKSVIQYDKNGNYIKTWDNANTVKEILGYSQSNISQCCLNIRKSAHNFIWKFVSET